MPVGYVTEPGATLRLHSGTVYVSKDRRDLAQWELARLDGICLWGPVHMTNPVMRALLSAGVEVALLSSRGRLVGHLTPPRARNVELRFRQYRLYDDPPSRLELAKTLVTAKINNARSLLLRCMRNHPEIDLSRPAADLADARDSLQHARSLDALTGHEGNAARTYFEAFGRMCRGELTFEKRSTRPPKDPVNALLSLAYTFMTNELTSLLDGIGFDPYIGFFHSLDYGRPSLALDLVEPFRHALCDRIVLHLVNNRVLTDVDFEAKDDGCMLTRTGFQTFARHYERCLLRRRIDPPTGKRETYRRHVQIQAERFAATLTRNEPPRWFAAED